MATSTEQARAPRAPSAPTNPPSERESLDVLRKGSIALRGLFEFGSNYTFLCEVSLAARSVEAVYKPTRGERPLWDFPPGSLAQREVAAYLVSRALGWDLVPATVLRASGPYGAGSLQEFKALDLEQDYFAIRAEAPESLRRVAAFDMLVNNADRKAGHVVRDAQGHLWLIDHGLCFHAEPKLRTVIWDFAGEAIPADLLEGVSALAGRLRSDAGLGRRLGSLLQAQEVEALARRAHALLRIRRYPQPGPGPSVPWPIWV